MAVKNKKLNLKDKYQYLTRDMAWEPSYQKKEDIFPDEQFEGIKITDWSQWEDPIGSTRRKKRRSCTQFLMPLPRTTDIRTFPMPAMSMP